MIHNVCGPAEPGALMDLLPGRLLSNFIHYENPSPLSSGHSNFSTHTHFPHSRLHTIRHSVLAHSHGTEGLLIVDGSPPGRDSFVRVIAVSVQPVAAASRYRTNDLEQKNFLIQGKMHRWLFLALFVVRVGFS